MNTGLKKQVSNRSIAKERDNKVIEVIGVAGALSREQIQALCFAGMVKKCQQRLKVLHDRGKLSRGRCDVVDSYVYWVDKKPGQIDHTILLNWVYVAVQQFKPKAWIREYKTDYFVADAFTILSMPGRIEPLFIEMQRKINNSQFDKVPKYIDYFKSAKWTEKKWAQANEKGQKVFPRVLVVTDGPTEKLERIVKEENEIGLRFAVMSLDRFNIRRLLI